MAFLPNQFGIKLFCMYWCTVHRCTVVNKGCFTIAWNTLWRPLTDSSLLVNFSAPNFGNIKPKVGFKDPTYLVPKFGAEKLTMACVCTWSTTNIYVYLPLTYLSYCILISEYNIHCIYTHNCRFHDVFIESFITVPRKNVGKQESKYFSIPCYVMRILTKA